MISIGSLIGSIIGFKFGGFMGLFLGAFVGFKTESWVSENIFGKPSHKTQVQQAYFKVLFTAAGKIAKADGIVSQSEVFKCEQIMKKMQLDATQRKEAIRLFNLGKQSNYDLDSVLINFSKTSGRSFAIKQMLMEMLLEIATAENKMSQAELNVLMHISHKLNFPQAMLVALLRMRGFNVGTGQSNSSHENQQKWSPPKKTTVDSYKILGVQRSDTKVIIRRAYKKLMSQHHPDKLIAKGLPPEMIEIAKTKTQNIQAAWEDIKNQRGF